MFDANAQNDGKQYGLQDCQWTEIVIPDSFEAHFFDTPVAGKQYARQDEAWTEVAKSITNVKAEDGCIVGRNENGIILLPIQHIEREVAEPVQ